ncbi:P-loop NTPase fold protein [Mitsuaria sp. 7]|uniref:KAP family P-loop NTPase fold protein n=1 Tax=Mitsuaria sp. 7 TaxID=1658665 RepID=UPI0007DD4B49|nr:P-loop NTPase fold protein [Mitsuaria sp. 7]ANH66593.1 hypothetical protein ABE85_01700 [Mitsuaria sp. 7]
MTEDIRTKLGVDQPLTATDGLAQDKLRRLGFARAAVQALQQVSTTAGFVVSVEGAWGSGKTSVLGMMEALLGGVEQPPLVIHFNPWQIGERDALLRAFFGKLAGQLELSDNVASAKRAAHALKSYSKVFDVIKLVPGAGELASAAQDIITGAGEAMEIAAAQRETDVEGQKRKVECALREFNRRIVVFVDDIDRLFPQEVFEMVRIIKAVGDLPNVGYVLAWDQEYVGAALKAANVPRAESYLDKVVQVRLPLPAISHAARTKLFDEGLMELPDAARAPHFPEATERLSTIYFLALRDLLEQPRDFTRIFNTAAVIEPSLRGEVVLADIVGLAALMVKAGSVYELLKREPRGFVGRMPADRYALHKDSESVNDASSRRDAAIAQSSWPEAVRRLVYLLFPLTATADNVTAFGSVSDSNGHLAAPERLMVALQMHVGNEDVSYVQVRKFLTVPSERLAIVRGLSVDSSAEFLDALGALAAQCPLSPYAATEACLDISSFIEEEPLASRAREQGRFFSVPLARTALEAMSAIIKASAPTAGPSIAARLIANAKGLTIATEVFLKSFCYASDSGDLLVAEKDQRDELAGVLAENILAAAKHGELFALANSGRVLWSITLVSKEAAPQALERIRALDPTLDRFATEILGHSYDSHKGLRFSLPEETERLQAFMPLDEFKAHARTRLEDPNLRLPALAAWRAVAEESSVYAVDGSNASQH